MRDNQRQQPPVPRVEPSEQHPHRDVADEGPEPLVQVVATAQHGADEDDLPPAPAEVPEAREQVPDDEHFLHDPRPKRREQQHRDRPPEGVSAFGSTCTVIPMARPPRYRASPGTPMTTTRMRPPAMSRHGRLPSMPNLPRCGRAARQSRKQASATGTRSKKIASSWYTRSNTGRELSELFKVAVCEDSGVAWVRRFTIATIEYTADAPRDSPITIRISARIRRGEVGSRVRRHAMIVSSRPGQTASILAPNLPNRCAARNFLALFWRISRKVL